ncbi:MAG: universal stress protein [Methanomassiliicoccales archaeon]|nr:MAG: universal stress protein [Methanomassiliicoccales archaeon]
MLFDKVLIPVDLSDASVGQVDCIVGMRHYGLKEAVLYYAIDVGDAPTQDERSKLEALAEKFSSADIPVKVVTEVGKPSTMILKAAKKEKATMIAMASSGKSKKRELVVGSVSLEVVRRSKVPVLIGKFEGGLSHKVEKCPFLLESVLISMDLGPSTKILMQTFKEIDAAGCKKAVLFHVVQSAKYSVEDDVKFQQVKEDLLKWKEGHKGTSELDTHLHYGTPAYNILEAAREFDSTLIIMGNVGKGLLHSMTLGSVSDEVLRKSPVHVLIVPVR